MIVWGFADTFSEAVNTLTGDNARATNQKDTFVPLRPAILQKIGGAAGAFDAWGDTDYPPAPVVVTTEADIYGGSFDEVSTRAQAIIDYLHLQNKSKLFFVPHSLYTPAAVWFPSAQLGTITGTTNFDGGARAGCRVDVEDGSGNIIASTTSGLLTTYSIKVPAGSYTVRGTYWDDEGHADGTLSPIVVTAGGTTAGTDTNAFDDGDTALFRWSWAKCIAAYAVENPKLPKRALKLIAKFEVAEGVAYAGAQTTVSKDEGDGGTFNITPVGNYLTLIKNTITANANSVTQVVITNNDNSTKVDWSGALLAADQLIINSETRSITNDGADTYAELSLNANQVEWSYMDPAVGNTNHSFTVAITQDTADNWNLFMQYWDTYILG